MALPRSVVDHLTSHHGVISRSQLVTFGLAPRRVDRLVASGALESVHRSVYRLAGAPPTPLQAVAAACAFDDRVIASDTAAGRLWEWRKMGDTRDVTVLVPGVSSPLLAGVTIHRCHRIERSHWVERTDGAFLALFDGDYAVRLARRDVPDVMLESGVSIS